MLPKRSCFFQHAERYTFHITDIKSIGLGEKSKNFRQVQEIMKKHIFTYGPVISSFFTTPQFKKAYSPSAPSFPSLLANGVFIDTIDYTASTYTNIIKIDTSTLQLSSSHGIAIVGWGTALSSQRLLD